MLNYDMLSRKLLIFMSFTGFEVSEFDALCSKIKKSYVVFPKKRLHKVDRKRKIDAGPPSNYP